MKRFNKIYALLLVFVSTLVFANGDEVIIPPPSEPQIESVTPGAPAAPIDMYIYVLGVVAIFMVIRFALQYRKTEKI